MGEDKPTVKRIRRAIFAVFIVGGIFLLVQLIWDYSANYGFTLYPLLQKKVAVLELMGGAIKTALLTAASATIGILLQWRKAD